MDIPWAIRSSSSHRAVFHMEMSARLRVRNRLRSLLFQEAASVERDWHRGVRRRCSCAVAQVARIRSVGDGRLAWFVSRGHALRVASRISPLGGFRFCASQRASRACFRVGDFCRLAVFEEMYQAVDGLRGRWRVARRSGCVRSR